MKYTMTMETTVKTLKYKNLHFSKIAQDRPYTFWHTAISRKGVGKSARDNPKRYCGLFWVSFFFKEIWKNGTWGTWGHGHMFCERKAPQITDSTATIVRNSVLIIFRVIFRDCRVHIFSDDLSRNSCIQMVISTSLGLNRIWCYSVSFLYKTSVFETRIK